MASLDESKKRKAEGADEEPPAKREAKDGEQEVDAADDSRPALKTPIGFNAADTTLNVFTAMDNKVLMSLTEGGMQYLIAGARGNVGMKAGRYMFEVKIIEALTPSEGSQGMRGPQPRQMVRLGFSTAASPLILGDSEDCVYFDNDGMFGCGKTRSNKAGKFQRDQAVAIVLNLDSSSPNANTISIFRDGVRSSDPQALPECLIGKELFPHICYRNVSVQVNMGPTPFKALPFNCRLLQAAATADVMVSKDQPKDGKYQVMVPVGVPDEGTFEWLDDFLEKNPSFVELSDRKLQDWAVSSGMAKPRPGASASNDKPTFAYSLQGMDDMSIQRVVKAIAPMAPRNYVVMEVRSNLVKDERVEVLKRFNTPNFKKTAMVVMGEPKGNFKERAQARILANKKTKLEAEWKLKKTQNDQKKQMAQRQKELAAMRKKADDAKRKAEGLEPEPEKEEEKEEEIEDVGEEPPKAVLTKEEEKLLFAPKVGNGDLAPAALSKSLQHFSVPERSEGFDEVTFVWDTAPKCKEYLRAWVVEAKKTTLMEHLQPSDTFTKRMLAWQKQIQELQQKQNAFKQSNPKKEEGKESDLDVFAVEDISDIGGGEPLYANFEPGDWALMQLRCELYMLQDAWQKDVDDPDRPAIPEAQISFYYQKYFRKQLSPQNFNLKTATELINLIKDVVVVSGEPPVLVSQLSTDLEVDTADIFVKFAEESRRDRNRRLAAGDETHKLTYTPPAAPQVPAAPTPKAPAQQQWQPAPRAPMGMPGKGGWGGGGWGGGGWGGGGW
eukprot:TRINITY_DN91827_c0_g1_i1.p1 TRINITY_DN91827_c0_g1~~TRINITY_DN91827_c0_g1_i1.p1  ORF type:complete len:779 (+),score=244.32 TRINITY_DN91827_c0_g1_i1:71-2407(+)